MNSIRESRSSDLSSILSLHEDAFGETEGKVIEPLVRAMFADESAEPLLSLVLEDGDEIVGQILFSRVRIEGAEELPASILAPLAVSSARHGQGLGTKLIEHGLEVLKQRGVAVVLVYGDPRYYSRTGFDADHHIEAPHKLEYPEAWMALELEPGALARAKGVARCCAALNAPELW